MQLTSTKCAILRDIIFISNGMNFETSPDYMPCVSNILSTLSGHSRLIFFAMSLKYKIKVLKTQVQLNNVKG